MLIALISTALAVPLPVQLRLMAEVTVPAPERPCSGDWECTVLLRELESVARSKVKDEAVKACIADGSVFHATTSEYRGHSVSALTLTRRDQDSVYFNVDATVRCVHYTS
jgi:hypothetical protein